MNTICEEIFKDENKDDTKRIISVSDRYLDNVKKGNIGVGRIVHKLRSLGYFVVVPSRVNKGVDILVFDKSTAKLIKVIEVTNYAESSFMKDCRVRRYINSLNVYDELPNVEKVIYISYLNNLTKLSKESLELIESNHIKIEIVGYQELNEKYLSELD